MWPASPVRRPLVVRSELSRGEAGAGSTRERRAISTQETVDESMQRFETLAYDSWRKIGMAGPADAAGVHSGVGGVSERDHGDAHCDSRARSEHAERRGHKCFGSEPDTAVARAGAPCG